MASPIGKLAPTAVVVVAVSYCAWPYVFPSSDGAAKQAAAMPEIAATQLSPVILPPPKRDPFQELDGAVNRTADRNNAAAAPVAGVHGAAGSRAASAARGKSNGPADPLGDLALSATSILADRRLAVINGRIYAEQERLTTQDPSAPPCTVVRILRDRVMLECEGRTTALHYADAAAQPKANHDVKR